MLVSEEEPVLPFGSAGRTLFDEGAEGSDPGAGADHDDGRLVVLGEAEVVVVVEEDPDLVPDRDVVGDVARGDPGALAIVGVIAHRCDREMDFVLVFFQARGDGIKSRGELAENPGEGLGGPVFVRIRLEQIDELASVDPGFQLGAALGIEEFFENGIPDDGVEFIRNGRGERGDVKVVTERVGEGLVSEFGIGAESGRGEDAVDDGGPVLGIDPEGVAGLVDEARSLEGELDVEDFLARTGPVEDDLLRDLGGVGVLLVIDHRGHDGAVNRRGRGDGLGFGEGIESACEPGVECRFVIDVAIDAVIDADRSEFGETAVEVFPHFAEVLVAGVAESADRVAQSGDLRHRVAHETLVVTDSGIRRVALAPGADDDEEILDLHEIGWFRVGHVGDGDFEVMFRGSFGDGGGELFTVPRLGSVENGEFALFSRGEHGREASDSGGRGGTESGKKAREPEGLVAVESGHELAGELLLLGIERGEVRETHGRAMGK